MSNPQFEALTHLVEHGELPARLDGMAHKALRSRGWVANGQLTEDGAIAQRTEFIRRNERGLRGVRRGDMIRWRNDVEAPRGRWGVVLSFTAQGEVRVRFDDVLTLYIPGAEIEAVERRPA